MSQVVPQQQPAKKKLVFKSKEFNIATSEQPAQVPAAITQPAQLPPVFVLPIVQQNVQSVQPVVVQQQQVQSQPELKMKKKLKAPVKEGGEQKQPEVKVEVVTPPQPEKEKVPEKVVPQQPAKTVVSYELIAYFLDKDVQLEVDNDTRKTFDTRLVTFLNRKYEISAGKEFNRNSNKNNTVKPNGSTYNNNKGNYKQYNNNNNGNSFPNADTQFQRGDSKKLTTPNLSKNNSAVVSIKRGEEDKDITQKKLKIKEQSAQFLEKMREEKQDNFKKQISEIRLDLNILTPTNFDVIKKKLFELAMIDENLCEHVVEGIIEKARTQKTYSMVYADLCKFMLEESKKVYGEKKSKAGETSTPADDKLKWFKHHLYTNIQQTFEGDKDIYNNKMTFAKPKALQELSTEEEKTQYFADKKKREMLNVKFIGNLYLNKSMNFKILAICLSELLGRFVQGFCSVTDQQRDNQEVEEAHYEDHLEALIALFEQTGVRLEAESKKSTPSAESPTVLKQLFEQIEVRKLNEVGSHIENLSFEDYFILIDWLRKNKKVSPRIYSLITNLVERKNESWKERLSTQKGPESITTLHQKHEEEMKQNQKELDNYEKGRKQGGNNRGYNKKDNNKKHTVYQPANGKYDEKSGIVRAKEFWAYLDAKVKLQEDYGVPNAINDFKQFKEQCDPVTFGEILIKTVYDCNKIFKDNRVEVAKEAAALITGEQFLKAFNERLNKSKDESSDFPLFLEFLSELFAFFFKQGTIQYNQLKISYKAEYDEDDKEDLNFVYMQFFEETINLHKQTQPFDAAAFIKEQVDPVLKDKDSRYASWVKDNSN